jgi:CheY-like chemotaxis protein
MRRLLIVGDDSMGTFATRVLGRAAFATTQVATGEEALAELAGGWWDALLSDTDLPGMSGLELVTAARYASPHLVIALMTTDATSGPARELVDCGADVVLAKPLTPAGLATAMNEVLGPR